MFKFVLGIDEAGRGPLAGPLSVAGVVINAEQCGLNTEKCEKDLWWNELNFEILNGIKDSKRLTKKARERWRENITGGEIKLKNDFVFINNDFIDKKGMTVALKIGVEKLLAKLEKDAGISPDNCFILLDGLLKAPEQYKQKSIVKGDELIPVIAAASVIAKVARDKQMLVWHEKFPQYCFDKHKGYGTRLHYEKLKEHGPCEIHRKTFCEDLTVWDEI